MMSIWFESAALPKSTTVTISHPRNVSNGDVRLQEGHSRDDNSHRCHNARSSLFSI